MPTKLNLHTMQRLSDNKDQILLETHIETELHIIQRKDDTIIKLPYGNKFDIVNGDIIIKRH